MSSSSSESSSRASSGPSSGPSLRLAPSLFAAELRLVFRRVRTYVLLGVLVLVPAALGLAVWIETGGAGGPAFLGQVTNNGLFLVFSALVVTLPFFLPMTVGVVAGDSMAGEASTGTLRYLLVAPAGRTRLLLVKLAGVLTFCLAATFTVAVAGFVVGAALFPLGEVTLLSGATIAFPAALLRAFLVAVVVAASLIGLAAIGIFVSTVTNVPIAAMAATVGVGITVQILDSIPQLAAIHPWLFSHYWMSFADLLRSPVFLDDVVRNLVLQGVYLAVFGSLAWARLSTRDVLS